MYRIYPPDMCFPPPPPQNLESRINTVMWLSWQVRCTSKYVSYERSVERSPAMHAMLSSEPSCSRGWIIATDSLPKHRTIFWLNCPVWCEPLPESSSNCLAEVRCPMPSAASSTGSTSRSGSVSNCAYSRIAVSMEQLLPTYRSAVFRSVRSPDDHTSVQPHLEICSFQGRTLLPLVRGAFAVACPAAWNSLPAELHEDSLSLLTFRKKLKTYLFISRTWTVICDVTLFVSAANHAFVTF